MTAVLAVLPGHHSHVLAAEARRDPEEHLSARHTGLLEGQVHDDRTGLGEEDRAAHRAVDIDEAGRKRPALEAEGNALLGVDNGHLVEEREEGDIALAAGEGLAAAGSSRLAGVDSLAEEDVDRVVVVDSGPEEGKVVGRSLEEALRASSVSGYESCRGR